METVKIPRCHQSADRDSISPALDASSWAEAHSLGEAQGSVKDQAAPVPFPQGTVLFRLLLLTARVIHLRQVLCQAPARHLGTHGGFHGCLGTDPAGCGSPLFHPPLEN